MAGKYIKVGTVLKVKDQKTGEPKETIKLGQSESKDPKYNYTVQIRVYEGSPETKEDFKTAKVLGTFTNPWVNFNTPHKNAPVNILNELQVYVKED